MLGIGSVKSEIIHCLQDGKVQFDINGFLQSVVLADLSNSGKWTDFLKWAGLTKQFGGELTFLDLSVS